MTASSYTGGFSPKNLFPSDPDEYKDSGKDWSTEQTRLKNGLTEWVALQFDTPRRVTQYSLISSAFAGSLNPAAWMLEGSTDRTTWTTIHSQTTTDASSIDFKENVETKVNIRKTFTIQSKATYKYVRLVISKTWYQNDPTAGYRVDLAGWDLRTTTGGLGGVPSGPTKWDDVTLQDGSQATMTASSYTGGYLPENLFPSDPEEYKDEYKDWASESKRLKNGLTEWVALKFNEPRRVTQYTLISSTYNPTLNPAAWILEGSTDGQSWMTIHSQTTTQTDYFKTQDQVSKTFTVQSKMFTYVRLAISKTWYQNDPNEGYRVDLAGWDLRTTISVPTTAPPSGVTLQDGTPLVAVTSSSIFQSYKPENLFPSDPEEYKDPNKDWASQGKRLKNGQTEWVAVQFASPRRVTQYTLISSTYNPSLNPAAWVLEGSTDGTTWTTLDAHTSDRTEYFKTQDQVSKTYVIQSNGMYTYVRLAISKTWYQNDPDAGYRVDLAGWDLRTSTTTLAPTAAPTPPPVPQVDPTLYVIIHGETWNMQGKLAILTWNSGTLKLEPYRQRDLSQVFLTNSMGVLRNGAGQGPYLKHNEGCLLPMFTMSPGQDAMWQTQSTGTPYEYTITSSCGAPLHSTVGSSDVDLSNASTGTTWFVIPVGTATL
jgi:hypothetical protein